MFYAVIGSNFGDEGKGLAVDHLTLKGHDLVVRHNGGAQSAHTVEKADGKFVFHELSSGSFNGADTYWASTFFPDLYKLNEEIEGFSAVSDKRVKIYASPDASVTLLYDAYLNQKIEESRGDEKHGSCGMGIWEATRRSGNGFAITLGDIASLSAEKIASKLTKIEDEYVPLRIEKYSISEGLNLDTIRYAELLKEALEKNVELTADEASLFASYDNVIFETGQGLLLDVARKDLWPHTTCSRTNLTNPVSILSRHDIRLDEAVYVARTYLTRHGAGPFNEDKEMCFEDRTNQPNPWQDSIRFGRYPSAASLTGRIVNDVKDNCPYDVKASLFLTHLNMTGDKILTEEGDIELKEFESQAVTSGIDKFYLSRSRYGSEVLISDGNPVI